MYKENLKLPWAILICLLQSFIDQTDKKEEAWRLNI